MKTTLVTLALFLGACDIGYCAAAPGEAEVSLYVSDSTTGAAVRQPTFDSYGTPLIGKCQDPSVPDPLVCVSWVVVMAPSQTEIVVRAVGYKPATVAVDTRSTMSIHLGVELEAL